MRISPRQSVRLLKSKMAGNILAGLFLTLGFGFLIYSAKITLDARSAKTWVKHDARIENARLETHVKDNGGKSYSVIVAYQYEWEGQSYTGKRYRLHDNAVPFFEETNEFVLSLLKTKEEGGRYPVFVNPKEPSQSAIKNTVPPKATSSSLFLGGLFSVIGLFILKPKFSRRRED